jgi:hypothetical protein
MAVNWPHFKNNALFNSQKAIKQNRSDIKKNRRYNMDKETIIKSLDEAVIQFNEFVSKLKKDEFEININNRWSAGQDLVHLIKVLRIVNIGFTLPKPVLRLMYGINKNENRSFEHLQQLYKTALAGGAKAPTIYIPKPVVFKEKDNLIQKHESLNKSFIYKLNNHTQFELDSYRLPHPILGKISLGELAIFTSFHTTHHLELLKSKLQ